MRDVLSPLPSGHRNAAGVPGTVSVIKRKILTALANTTCDGQPAFSLYSCVYNGTLCSDAGLCSGGTCACFSGYSVRLPPSLLHAPSTSSRGAFGYQASAQPSSGCAMPG